jgi:hypothetical protein
MFDDLEAEGCSLCIRRLTGMVPHEHRKSILKPCRTGSITWPWVQLSIFRAHRSRLRTGRRQPSDSRFALSRTTRCALASIHHGKKILRRLPDTSYGGGHLIVHEAQTRRLPPAVVS